MRRTTGTKEDIASRVADMFRIAESRDDMTLKRLSALSSVPYDTLNSYRKGTAMPLHAFVAIAQFIENDLLSLCIEPADKHVGSNEPGDGDLCALGREAAGFVADKLDRESDGNLCHIDKAKLRQRARKIAATARSAAA